VLVHEANIQDYRGGKRLLAPLNGVFPRLKLIWADSSYKKEGFGEWVKATLGWEVEIVEHPWSGLRGVWAPKDAVIDWEQIRPSGFHVLPHRWIVERTFAWLSTWRRLANKVGGQRVTLQHVSNRLFPNRTGTFQCIRLSRPET
jgi:putative transposase